MAFVPAPNIMQVEIRMELAGQKIENRIMIDALAPITATHVFSTANAIGNWVQTSFAPQLPDAVHFREVYVKDLSSQDGFEATHPFTELSGSVIGVPLPNHVTICASLRTGHIGRSARGRLYWPCLTQDQVTDNTVNAATLASFRTVLLGLLDLITGDMMMAWVVVSFRHNNEPRPGGPVYYMINNILFTDDTVDSQRRRLPGRGQ